MFVPNYVVEEAIAALKDSGKPTYDLEYALEKEEKRRQREEEKKLAFRKMIYDILNENKNRGFTATEIQYLVSKREPLVSLPKIVGNLRQMRWDRHFPNFTKEYLDRRGRKVVFIVRG